MSGRMVRILTTEDGIVEIAEEQIVEVVTRLSKAAQEEILKRLVADDDGWEAMHVIGDQRIRAICAERGIDWDALNENEKDEFIDFLLHEK